MKELIQKILSRTGLVDLPKNIGDAFDANFTSNEEKLELRNALVKQATDLVVELQSLRAKIIKIESDGNWLQRSWRPIVMIIFCLIIVHAYFTNRDLNQQFWELLKLGMGGYVIGRSSEKVVRSVSENLTIKSKKSKS